MYVISFEVALVLAIFVGLASTLTEVKDDGEERSKQNQAKGICGFPLKLGNLSDMDNQVIRNSLEDIKALVSIQKVFNVSVLCSVVQKITEWHQLVIHRNSENQLKKKRQRELNMTLMNKRTNVMKIPAKRIFPGGPFPSLNNSHLLLPPLFRSIRVLVTTVISNRTETCSKKGGSYNIADGTCRIKVKKVMTDHLVSERWRSVILYVGNIFSILTLLIVLVVYTVLKELRNVPGKNVVCLSLAMMTGHILQMVAIFADEPPVLCRVTGILLHWAYIWSFVWMSIISFDIFKTFVLFRAQSGSKGKFKHYLITGTTLPTFLVLIYVIVDVSTDRVIGYGQHKYCFIVTFWPNISFMIFVGVTLLLNVVCVITVARVVYKTRLSTGKSFRTEKNRVRHLTRVSFMVLRISTLIGVGWVFGIIGASLSNTALYYVFLVVVHFQGVLVFLAFVCSKRVYRLLKFAHKDGDKRKSNCPLANSTRKETTPSQVRRLNCSVETVMTEC